MIQDIYPKIFKNQFEIDIKPEAHDKVLAFKNDQILIKKGMPIDDYLPQIMNFNVEKEFIYLFAIDEERYFLAKDVTEEPEGFSFVGIRSIRDERPLPNDQMMPIYTGKHLADWYRDMKYCGRCGSKMIHATKERAMKCTACEYRAYPRIMPAVIVGVLNQDKILLTKYKAGFRHFALIAGFTEIGETVEETVHREVMEEAGLKVKNIRYYKSQPWGIANDILLGFFCEVDGDATIHMDENELKLAKWMSRDEVILQPDGYSLTNEMMKLFKDGEISAYEMGNKE